MPERIDASKVVEYLNKFWKGTKVCPICKNNSWGIADNLAAIQVFDKDRPFYSAGPVWPLIPIGCNVCGYTFYLNALVAGFLKGDESPSTATPAPPPVQAKDT